MEITVGRKTIDSLGAKLDQLHNNLNDHEKALLGSVLKTGAGGGAKGGNLPSDHLRNVTGKVQLGSDLVSM
jgi:hypothetical protein